MLHTWKRVAETKKSGLLALASLDFNISLGFILHIVTVSEMGAQTIVKFAAFTTHLRVGAFVSFQTSTPIKHSV